METRRRSLLACLLWAGASAATYLQRYIPGETLIVQFGTPRTATTLQHRIVLNMAQIKNREYGESEIPGNNVYVDGVPFPLDPNRVFKTHLEAEELYDYLDGVDAKVLVFTTAFDEEAKAEALRQAATNGTSRVAYVQLFDTVKYSPLLVVRDYASIFNLTTDQLARSVAGIEHWDTWRLCCGHQSALSNRLRLHGCPPLRPWYDPMEAHCERYNLTAIEDLFALASVATLPSARNGEERFKYDRPDDVVRSLPEETKENLGIGECVKETQKVIDGLDFNWNPFTTCEALVDKWAHDDYNDYVCRNYPDSHERLCQRTEQRQQRTEQRQHHSVVNVVA